MFGKRWFGLALIFAVIATFVGASVRTEIKTEPVPVVEAVDMTNLTVNDLEQLFQDAFLDSVDAQFADIPDFERSMMQMAFGAQWRHKVRRLATERGWPVVRRHFRECCASVMPDGPTGNPEDIRRFMHAMEQRRPTISQEVEQQIRDALSRGELLSS